MEDLGNIIKSIGNLLRIVLKILMYVGWGLSRILETVLHELNALLKTILEKKKQ